MATKKYKNLNNIFIYSWLEKQLEKLPKDTQRKIEEIILEISETSINNRHIQKLKGSESKYKYRIGDYRMIFYFNAEEKEIIIISIDHRKQVYKDK